jgi:threonyl-tRNA synthetase
MENTEKLMGVRHALAHLTVAAVRALYPHAQNAIGPAIDNGFYQDFDMGDTKLSEDDLPKIQTKMVELLKNWVAFDRREVTLDEALKEFSWNIYKTELIKEFSSESKTLTFYTCGGFVDLCKGGHAENPAKDISADSFKLDRIAGAYWRGDEKNKMLTRIYGLAFETKENLDAYILQQEEAKKRDHRKLGAEMELFTFSDLVGPGLPLWLPNGTVITEELEKLAKETEFLAGYDRVRTPHLGKESLYLTSGHLPYYEESMYPPMEYEGGKYYLKAMNCPHHHQIFAAGKKSYKDLPLRLAEYGMCYRHEKSGELFGLMRVRSLSMNDAHIYCTEEQFADEFRAVNEMYLKYFKIFGVDKYVMRFSTHSPKKLGKKYVDQPELWKKTEDMVRQVLIESKIPYVEIPDEAAFYGPKIDVQVWSAIGREFTLATNQVDFAVPARFGLTYTSSEGKQETPLCIHRAPLGTHERFTGFLIEHYAGIFPTWLSPLQVAIVPVKEMYEDYAKNIEQEFKNNFIRANIISSNDSLGKRIHEAKKLNTPYVIVIGDKEKESGILTIETRTEKIQMTLEEFSEKIQSEIKNRS